MLMHKKQFFCMVTAISEMNVYITARPQAQLSLETRSRVFEERILSKTSLFAKIRLRDYDNGLLDGARK